VARQSKERDSSIRAIVEMVEENRTTQRPIWRIHGVDSAANSNNGEINK
jgi:hypothetical protein